MASMQNLDTGKLLDPSLQTKELLLNRTFSEDTVYSTRALLSEQFKALSKNIIGLLMIEE